LQMKTRMSRGKTMTHRQLKARIQPLLTMTKMIVSWQPEQIWKEDSPKVQRRWMLKRMPSFKWKSRRKRMSQKLPPKSKEDGSLSLTK
jgi:hypothetical protein